MIPAAAAKLLGLMPYEMGISERVRAAFAQRARECHPDTAPGATAERPLLRDLQTARDVLLEDIEARNRACSLCEGRGKVRAGMGWRTCGACDGKGERA